MSGYGLVIFGLVWFILGLIGGFKLAQRKPIFIGVMRLPGDRTLYYLDTSEGNVEYKMRKGKRWIAGPYANREIYKGYLNLASCNLVWKQYEKDKTMEDFEFYYG